MKHLPDIFRWVLIIIRPLQALRYVSHQLSDPMKLVQCGRSPFPHLRGSSQCYIHHQHNRSGSTVGVSVLSRQRYSKVQVKSDLVPERQRNAHPSSTYLAPISSSAQPERPPRSLVSPRPLKPLVPKPVPNADPKPEKLPWGAWPPNALDEEEL